MSRAARRRALLLLESLAASATLWAAVLGIALWSLWKGIAMFRRRFLASIPSAWIVNAAALLALLALLALGRCEAWPAYAMPPKPPPPPPAPSLPVLEVDAAAPGTPVAPGAFLYGAMWRLDDGPRALCAPGDAAWTGPKTDAEHAACVTRIGEALAPAMRETGPRGFSWNWGVTVTGDPLLGLGPWSARRPDCRPGSGVCEKPLIGPAEACALAKRWEAEAVAWGVTPTADAAEQARASHAAFAAGCPGVRALVAVGVEAAPVLGMLSAEQLAARVRAVRAALPESATVLVYGKLGARWGKPDAIADNAALARLLAGAPGVAFDVHPYLGDWPEGAATPMTEANMDRLLALAPREAPAWLRVAGFPGAALEFAVLGGRRDNRMEAAGPAPWPVALANADLLRECWAQGLGVCGAWMLSGNHPPEWPFGAVSLEGGEVRISDRARALGFLARLHRGALLGRRDAGALRLLASRTPEGGLALYGGCFSRTPCEAEVRLAGGPWRALEAMTLGLGGAAPLGAWGPGLPLRVPAMSLVRLHLARGGAP